MKSFENIGTWDILQYQLVIAGFLPSVVPAIIQPLFVETVKLLKSYFFYGRLVGPSLFPMVSWGFCEGSLSFPAHKPYSFQVIPPFLERPPIPQEVYDYRAVNCITWSLSVHELLFLFHQFEALHLKCFKELLFKTSPTSTCTGLDGR